MVLEPSRVIGPGNGAMLWSKPGCSSTPGPIHTFFVLEKYVISLLLATREVLSLSFSFFFYSCLRPDYFPAARKESSIPSNTLFLNSNRGRHILKRSNETTWATQVGRLSLSPVRRIWHLVSLFQPWITGPIVTLKSKTPVHCVLLLVLLVFLVCFYDLENNPTSLPIAKRYEQ